MNGVYYSYSIFPSAEINLPISRGATHILLYLIVPSYLIKRENIYFTHNLYIYTFNWLFLIRINTGIQFENVNIIFNYLKYIGYEFVAPLLLNKKWIIKIIIVFTKKLK